MAQPQPDSDIPIVELRKSKRKRIPTKRLAYKDTKTKSGDNHDETLGKSKKKKDPCHINLHDPSESMKTNTTAPVSRVTFLVKKTYEKVRRNYTAKRAANVKSLWGENVQRLDTNIREHAEFRKNITTNSKIPTLTTDDLISAFQSVTSEIKTSSALAVFKIFPAETLDTKSLKFIEKEIRIESSVVTLPSLNQIPPVLAWTSIPYNIHEDDGKFLTNIPFLGDEIIDKDKKFIDDMVNLYEGKIHGICHGAKVTRMEDEVFHDFVIALMEVESKNGPDVFKDSSKSAEEKLTKEGPTDSRNESQNLDTKTVVPINVLNTLKEDKIIKVVDQSCSPSIEVLAAISSTIKGIGTVDELKDRYEAISQRRRLPKLPLLSSGIEQHGHSSYSIPNIEGRFAKDLPKSSAMHAYQFLFCRRCFQYDCTRGHNGDDHIDLKCYKKNRDPQNISFNFVCEDPNCWQKKDPQSVSPETLEKSKEDILKEWTAGDKSMFRCLIDSFPSHCYVSKLMMNKSCNQVHEYANIENAPTDDPDSTQTDGEASQKPTATSNDSNSNTNNPSVTTPNNKRRSKPWNKKSTSVNKKNVARRWINNVKRSEKTSGGIKTGGVLPPKFMPCQHDHGVECDDKNPLCYCGKNGTSCEKFCGCPATCQRRFPGCRCTSTCDSKRCVCFFAARECDPDLCTGCGAHEPELDKITCRNVNIQRRLHKHLLMGKSDVAGWGIFIKEEVQKGEFIAEYRGEIISHDESERRGHVYDKISHTFLFELNDHFVVDATRKGNKSRFVNSSKNPNCEVKRMLVNGDHRIGIYAKRCIEAGEELFYDYEDVLQKQQRVAAASVITPTSSHQHNLPQSQLLSSL